ncbi:MAG: phasin family protein [Betaproteobacteria bacterium]|nr:phasin family protein [Betaproteobacteria bacterium]
MATRKTASKTVSKSVKKAVKKPVAKKPVARKAAAKPAADGSVAHKMVLAGLGAAKKAQGEALKIYGAIAHETERLSQMTSETAQNLLGKASLFAKEGQKMQSEVQKQAEAKAREVAKEVQAFAAKSQKAFKKNVTGTINAANANAKESITRLEQVFEARVAKTLNTFGIPSAQNVRELQARMGELQKALTQLNKRGVRV